MVPLNFFINHCVRLSGKAIFFPPFNMVFVPIQTFHHLNDIFLHVNLRYVLEGGEVNLCGGSFLLLLLWLLSCVLQWVGVRVDHVDILALVVSLYGIYLS